MATRNVAFPQIKVDVGAKRTAIERKIEVKDSKSSESSWKWKKQIYSQFF